MTLHYHGTPITPRAQLLRMAGRHFCVSFAAPNDLAVCLSIGQSLMLDNGAFSTFTRGEKFDPEAFYGWLEPTLSHPHWAVVPDVIGGDVEQQRALVAQWPFLRALGAPVWHLGMPLDYLFELVDSWPRVCLGSSAEYWNVGEPAWCGRMDEVFNALAARDARLPWLHGLRMLGMVGERWPLASADSTNVAQNWSRDTGCAECKADSIDGRQSPLRWRPHPLQETLCL